MMNTTITNGANLDVNDHMEAWKLVSPSNRVAVLSVRRMPIAVYLEGLRSDDHELVAACAVAMLNVRIRSKVSYDFSNPLERDNPRDYKVTFYEPVDADMEGKLVQPKHRKGFIFGLVVIEGRKPEWKWVSKKDVSGTLAEVTFPMGDDIGTLSEVAETDALELVMSSK